MGSKEGGIWAYQNDTASLGNSR